MSEPLRERLSAAVPVALRTRDRVALTALRSALSAVGNAEAVPVDTVPRAGAAEQSAAGVGAADVPRRALTESDVRAIVLAEVAEREDAAASLVTAGRPDDAARLRAEAAVLREHLDG
ncbi:MAG: hypothetical protein ACRCY8_20105 [Dermatophilaceae bacterium]